MEDPAIDVDIECLDTAGDGVARHRGQQLAVPFTIPGERVRVRPGSFRGTILTATLGDVLRPSPHRVVPYCPHFGSTGAASGAGPCGGCTWQHIAYPEQLRLKTDLVTRLVREALPRPPAVQPMIAGAAIDYPWGYRQKVHFVFGSAPRAGRRGGALVMGHYARGTRRIIAIRECPVHDERGNALAFRLHHAYSHAHVPAEPSDGAHPALKSIVIRVGGRSPEIMATLVLTGESDRRLRAATRRVLGDPAAPSSLHVNIHPRRDGFIFGRETRRVVGPERMREEVAGTSFLVSPTAFFQTNVHAAEILVGLVLDAVPAGAAVLDLYAGAGLFALPLARAGHQVVAVEENHEAVADAEASLRLNRIPPGRCRFIATSVEEALSNPQRRSDKRDGSRAADSASLTRRRAAPDGPSRAPRDQPSASQVVVLDPPREGCGPAVLHAVFGALAPPRAIYISCNPEALARDLAAIGRHGYRVESIQPVDMFPHTAHVEAVAVLTRR